MSRKPLLHAKPRPTPVGRLELGGAGRNFLWSILSPLVTVGSSFFLLSYSVRTLGSEEYGAVVTIGALTSLLTLFTGGLRYGVQRSEANLAGDADAATPDPGDAPSSSPTQMLAVRAAHSLFCAVAAALVLAAVALGWVVNVDLGIHGKLAGHVYVATILLIAAAAVLIAASAYAAILTGHERFGAIAKLSLGGFGVQVALTVALLPSLRIIGLGVASLGGAVFQVVFLVVLGRRRAPWLHPVPRAGFHGQFAPVVRYAGGIILLSFTAVISSASDAFVIGALRGGAAVAVFRIGSAAPTSLVGLLYTSFGVLFPRLIRSPSPAAQEEGVGWMGLVIGWGSGIAFAGLALLGPDVVRILQGRPDPTAYHILWIVTGALAVDISFHGVVQVLFARGEQGKLAKYTWIELVTNLSATVAFVALLGPIGSAWAMAATILVTDIIGFPIIMRGRWGSPAGRFVWRHGIVQTVASGALMLALCAAAVVATAGTAVHVAIVAGGGVVACAVGYAVFSAPNRVRLRSLVGARPAAEAAPA